jgi:hypothetical protein
VFVYIFLSKLFFFFKVPGWTLNIYQIIFCNILQILQVKFIFNNNFFMSFILTDDSMLSDDEISLQHLDTAQSVGFFNAEANLYESFRVESLNQACSTRFRSKKTCNKRTDQVNETGFFLIFLQFVILKREFPNVIVVGREHLTFLIKNRF